MIVVADTSVFLNLACIRQEHLLVLIFKRVLAPPEVRDEFERATKRYPRFASLTFPAWVEVRAGSTGNLNLYSVFHLDLGETMAIALASETKADAILIDERDGRRAAEALGLTAFGTIGVLIRAKRCGHVVSIAPLLDHLAEQANFYLHSEARREALVLAGEAS